MNSIPAIDSKEEQRGGASDAVLTLDIQSKLVPCSLLILYADFPLHDTGLFVAHSLHISQHTAGLLVGLEVSDTALPLW